jgi:hypothetical protein
LPLHFAPQVRVRVRVRVQQLVVQLVQLRAPQAEV